MKSRLLSTKKHRANASALGAESSRPWRIQHEYSLCVGLHPSRGGDAYAKVYVYS